MELDWRPTPHETHKDTDEGSDRPVLQPGLASAFLLLPHIPDEVLHATDPAVLISRPGEQLSPGSNP